MNRLPKILVHLMVVFAAFLLAFELRVNRSVFWWGHDPQVPQVLGWGALYVLAAAAVEMVFHDERASWRFTSLREALTLVRSTAITAAIFLGIVFLFDRASLLPRSVLPMAWLCSLTGLIGVRVVSRIGHDPALMANFFARKRRTGAPLVLVGDAWRAESYLRHLAADGDQHYNPVAILSLSRKEKGQLVRGVPIVGDVGSLAKPGWSQALSTQILPALLFLDDPIKGLGLSTDNVGRLRREGFKLLRQPNVIEVKKDEGHSLALREINLEEFLPRAPITLDPSAIEALVSGRRVLVTGAGGSIGSEIARQLASFGCAHLSLVDQSEFLLFEIHRELENAKHPNCELTALLCNVRDASRVNEVFAGERPDIIFHAAALKHVTLVENNPCEGVLTNVLGTWNVATAAAECAAAQMVMVSTDKAVAPSNVMGATKRLAESLLPTGGRGTTRYCVVRFGNVLGSAGSVVPIFRSQIESGGPVIVTHPEVERYFMTIPEAVQLVLQSAALNSGGEAMALRKFVLEMGDPVKIVDLARQMIVLSGRTPDVDIAIKFTGLRPGEKMTEALLDSNEIGAPCMQGITEIAARSEEGIVSDDLVSQLSRLAREGDAAALRNLIKKSLAAVREPETQVRRPRQRRVTTQAAG